MLRDVCATVVKLFDFVCWVWNVNNKKIWKLYKYVHWLWQRNNDSLSPTNCNAYKHVFLNSRLCPHSHHWFTVTTLHRIKRSWETDEASKKLTKEKHFQYRSKAFLTLCFFHKARCTFLGREYSEVIYDSLFWAFRDCANCSRPHRLALMGCTWNFEPLTPQSDT